MSATPAEIARRLTKAQQLILGLIEAAYGNDAFSTPGKAAVSHNEVWVRCADLAREGLCTVDESELPMLANPPRLALGYVALTPLGLLVRAELEKENEA